MNGQGWYVDDVQVGSTVDTVSSTAGWTTSGWLFSTGLQDNAWTADGYVPQTKAQSSSYVVSPITLATSGNTVSGSRFFDSQYKKEQVAWGVISNRPTGAFNANGRLTIAKGQG